MYDASNRKDIREAEKRAHLAERSRVEFIQSAMAGAPGRVWFYQLLSACHLFSDPFSGDALREAYTKGERNVGLMIFADILENCPDQYILMMREATERENVRSPRTSGSAEHSGGADAGWNVEGREPDDDDGTSQ